MKKTIYLFIVAWLPIAVFAQQSLQTELNAPRKGDNLIKQSIPYCQAGFSGANQVWDFSRTTVVDTDYPIIYFSREDESGVIGSEAGGLLHYRLSGDSLLMNGYETPNNLVCYSEAGLLLKFPVAYGDSLSDQFSGRGRHNDRIESMIAGSLTTVADGLGTIILPNNNYRYLSMV